MEPLRSSDPRTVGPYVILGLLSVGGMGRVYLGESPGGRQVAVKLMRAELTADPEFRARFAREVAAARLVGGYHTAQVIDADPDADPPWMVTAYIPAPSLQDTVAADGPLHSEALHQLAAGLIEGLAAIHACGLVHRDLNPRNILMAEDGPRIIDFGVARPASADATSLTATGKVVGTPAFMAPEQIDSGTVGPASDVFAFGGVMVFAATGRKPFGDRGLIATSYAIVNKEPDLRGVCRPLREVAGACLAKDPDARPTAEALLVTLSGIRHAMPLLPADPGIPPEPGMPPDHTIRLVRRDTPDRAAPDPVARTDPVALVGPAARPDPAARPFRLPLPARGLRPVPVQRAAPSVHAPEPRTLPARDQTPNWAQVQVRPASGGWTLLAADPAGRWLASADSEGAIAIWDIEPGHAVRSWSAGSRVLALAAGPGNLLAAAGNDGIIRMWDAVSGSGRGAFSSGTRRVGTLAFDRAGTRLAGSDDDNAIRLWTIESGRQALVAEFQCGFRPTAIAFGSRAELLAAGGSHGRVWAWDLTVANRDRWPAQVYAPVGGHRLRLGTVLALDFDDVADLWTTAGDDGPLGQFRAAAVIAASRSTAAADRDSGRIRVFPAGKPADSRYLLGTESGLRGVGTLRSGDMIVMIGTDGVPHVWDRRRAQMSTAAGGRCAPTALAISPDETRVAVCDEHRWIAVYDVVNGALGGRQWTSQSPDAVTAVTFRPDGKRLVTAGDAVRMWNASGGAETRALPESVHAALAIAYDPSGRLLAAAGADGTVLVWEGTELRCALAGHEGPVLSLAFGPAGGALEGHVITLGSDETIRIWDPVTGAERERLAGLGYRARVLAVGFSGNAGDGPGGAGAGGATGDEVVAVGCADGSVRLCTPPNWANAPVLTDHLHGITAMCFARDGQLVTASRDGTARVWDLAGRRAELVLAPRADGWAAAEVLTDGTVRGHGDTDGWLWHAAGLTREPV